MTKICFVMVGVSGCGKSTAVKSLSAITGKSNITTFSLDDCRLRFAANHIAGEEMRRGGMTEAEAYRIAFDMANENKSEFDAYVNSAWQDALKGDAIFVDNTNLTRKSRARWINDARAQKATIIGVEIHAPLDVVLARQALRGDKIVPANIVRDMYMRQQEMLLGSECDFILHIDGTKAQGTKAQGTFCF